MKGPEPPVAIETLLAHRPWVRRVARLIARDESEADDLEQEVLAGAVVKPPASGRSIRGWFAAALRHDLLDRRRSEAGRRRREEAGARPEAEPSAAELVAEAEAHWRVVVAVMDLVEPYRSTILFRFFEDLPPSAIAAREGIPLETVRTRLRRGLALLRERMDRGTGGDRGAWLLALLGERDGAGSAGAVAAGGILMAAKGWAMAAAVIVIAGAGWLALRDPRPGSEVASVPAPDPGPPPAARPIDSPVPPAPAEPDPVPSAPGEVLPVFPAPPEAPAPRPPAIRGRVRFAEGEAPPDRAYPQVRFLALQPGAPLVADDLRTKAGAQQVKLQSGHRFAFPRLKPGRYALGVQRSQNGPVAGVREVEVGDGIVDVDLEFPPLRRTDWIEVRALGPGGRAVKDLEFRLTYSLSRNERTGGRLCRDVVPGEEGAVRVIVEDLPQGSCDLRLDVESPALGILQVPADGGEATVRFAEPAIAALRFEGYEEGGPWDRAMAFQFLPADRSAGLAAVARGYQLGTPGQVPDEEGRMEVPLQPGRYTLAVVRFWRWIGRPSGTVPAVRPERTPLVQSGTVARVAVDLASGRNDVTVALPALHRLTVHGVEETLHLRRVGEPEFQLTWGADPSGTQVLEGIPGGEWHVFTGPGGKRRMEVALTADATVRF